MNSLYRNLNEARYHNLELRPSFNSWGGRTSGIALFISAPHLTTPQGYYVPIQNTKLRLGLKQTPHVARSKKRAHYYSLIGKGLSLGPLYTSRAI